MGITTPITTIILFTIITITTITIYNTIIIETTNIIKEKLSISREDRNTIITIENVQINSQTITLTLKNIAGNPIIFGGETYKWCNFIISYKAQNNTWITILIENYIIKEIKIPGTNITTGNKTLNPGQEATIIIQIPQTHPPIPEKSIVIIVFTTNNGIKTMYTGAR